MITQWLETFSLMLADNLWLGLLLSFVAGLLSSFTPCSLSSVPLVIGYVSGYTDNKKKAFFYSLMFCASMAVTFTAIGIIASLVGRMFTGALMYWYIILGALMLLMALQTWGVISILPQSCGYTTKKKGVLGALILGCIGAVFSSPCSTPVLIAILAVVSTGQSILFGALMLLLYSIGHSVLLLIAGTSVGWVKQLSTNDKFKTASKVTTIILGVIMMLLAIFMFYSAFV